MRVCMCFVICVYVCVLCDVSVCLSVYKWARDGCWMSSSSSVALYLIFKNRVCPVFMFAIVI